MMYNNKFVACVKVDGKICRERGSDIHIPFGSNYKILLKNLENRKAVTDITIDGRVVINGLIVDSNSSVELERFVEGYGFNSGPSFKFIEKTEKISEYRGNKIDDGLIRIEFKFEKEIKTPISTFNPNNPFHFYHYDKYQNNFTCTPFNNYSNIPLFASMSCNYENNNGITVNGEQSNQKFINGCVGSLETDSSVIILQLKGYNSNIKIQKPLTVNEKLICSVCGIKSSSIAKFCPECGNNLKF